MRAERPRKIDYEVRTTDGAPVPAPVGFEHRPPTADDFQALLPRQLERWEREAMDRDSAGSVPRRPQSRRSRK